MPAIRLPATPLGLLLACCLAAACGAGGPASANDAAAARPTRGIDFLRDVRPIFVERCLACHGPDDESGNLRVDLRESMFERPEGYDPLLVPGHIDRGTLLERVTSDDESIRMPADGDPLSDEQIALLRQWIAEGADWPNDAGHWAFKPPVRPPLPAVARADWVRTPIDRFVLARLESERLSPSAEADRPTLIRRLSLDLIGLPPTPDEVSAFLDDTAPDAYERLVDRLLDSPHYGERWAMRWLDLARYGDTGGYDADKVRPMWLYRDWVIDALNRDLPFDQFTIEQLAGDLLPDATPMQRVATGFIRSSAVPQYRFDELVDRVSTLGTVFMGLSFECAQCHNHKFDPLLQREFYELFAIFNNDDDVQVTARSPLTGQKAESQVVQVAAKPRKSHVMLGGSPFDKGEPVSPAAPAAFHPLPPGGVPDRLELARWLADPQNPLFARVAINRHWEALFGRGLVATSEDLGVRTDPASHPELLDWLAVEFAERRFRVKQMHRLMVTSAVYRQSSIATPELLERDPQNRLLARGSRFRVDAETIRDIALSAAGLLDRRVGGESVFPPQPYGITENRFKGAMTWTESAGADRYRRGLYTFWKRAALYPSVALFDAPRRETSCVRRARSNTPLQALVTLNDPAFFEAAVHLGRQMHQAAPSDAAEQIAAGMKRCVARPANNDEMRLLRAFHAAEHARFAAEPAAAHALLATAGIETDDEQQAVEWAALALVANVLLNLDETITRP